VTRRIPANPGANAVAVLLVVLILLGGVSTVLNAILPRLF